MKDVLQVPSLDTVITYWGASCNRIFKILSQKVGVYNLKLLGAHSHGRFKARRCMCRNYPTTIGNGSSRWPWDFYLSVIYTYFYNVKVHGCQP